MNEMYELPAFDLPTQIGYLINSIFVVLFFSAGIPALLFILIFTLLTTNLVDRYTRPLQHFLFIF